MNPFLHAPLAWAGLGLATIPIIIHLINRRRLRRIDWAAMEFLLVALRKNRRRLRIEHLILLATRILLMLLIAFFLARPLLSDRGFGWLANVLMSEDKVFVLDDSMSMGQRVADRSLLDRATRAVTDSLHRLAEGRSRDRVTVVRSSRPDAPVVRGSFVDRDRAAALQQTLESLSATSTRMDLARVIESVNDQATGIDEGQRPRVVSIVSDLRATDWTDGSGNANGALLAAFERLTENEDVPTRVVVLDVASRSSDNVAIVGLDVDGGRPAVGIPAQLRLSVRNFGTVAAQDLKLRVNYRPARADASSATTALASPIAFLDAGETTTVGVTCTFRTPGQYVALAELSGADDSLPEDDRFHFVLDVIEATKVLLVSGEPSAEPWEAETDFLATALTPQGNVGSGIEPVIAVEESLPRDALSEYAAVFLCNVYRLPEEFRVRLGRYVREGGNLVVFPGDQVDPVLYERDLGTSAGAADDDHPSRGLLPAALGKVIVQDDAPVGIVPALEHPYFRFAERTVVESLFEAVGFQRRFVLEPKPETRVLATFDDATRSPALVEAATGAGRVLLAASAADAEWNDWPRNPSYLMLLQRLVATFGREQSRAPEHVAGLPIEIPVDIGVYAQEARFRGPSYPESPERQLIAARPIDGDAALADFRFTIEETLRAGTCSLALDRREGGQEVRAFAIRSVAEESNLSRLSPDDVASLFPDLPIEVVQDPRSFSETGRGRFEVSDLLIALFALLLLLEGFMAWKFARHRKAGSSATAPVTDAPGRRRMTTTATRAT